MEEKQKLKNARGITLVALVVTIIVLIILAGVSINMVLGQNGIITKSKEAKEKTLNAEAHEKEQMNEVVDYIKNNGASSGNNKENDSEDNNSRELISKEESYVGYYADVDGDGAVDGVIFADLAIGASGKWGSNERGTFSYNGITGTKDYYVSKTNYEGDFGTKDVLTATGSGKDRFYVMALKDITSTETFNNRFAWYYGAESNIEDYSNYSINFGSGKTNTETMIEKWNNSIYGAQNADGTYLDIWGVIQEKVKNGWFVPSREEWSAFLYNIDITQSNYGQYSLSTYYWSSSIEDYESITWIDILDDFGIFTGSSTARYSVRLITTF